MLPVTFHKNKYGEDQKEYFKSSDHFSLMLDNFHGGIKNEKICKTQAEFI